jgi:hypothetical protein
MGSSAIPVDALPMDGRVSEKNYVDVDGKVAIQYVESQCKIIIDHSRFQNVGQLDENFFLSR